MSENEKALVALVTWLANDQKGRRHSMQVSGRHCIVELTEGPFSYCGRGTFSKAVFQALEIAEVAAERKRASERPDAEVQP